MSNLGQALLIPAFSVGARGATLASDSFTDTDGVLITAHTAGGVRWTKHVSSTNTTDPSIVSNRTMNEVAGQNSHYTTTSPPSAQYMVSCDVVMRSDNNASQCGPLGRLQAGLITAYHARYNCITNAWQLYKFVANVPTQLGADQLATLTVDVPYRCSLLMVGTTISMLVNGVTLLSVTDTSVSGAGLAGIRWGGVVSSTTGVHLDNYEVRLA